VREVGLLVSGGSKGRVTASVDRPKLNVDSFRAIRGLGHGRVQVLHRKVQVESFLRILDWGTALMVGLPDFDVLGRGYEATPSAVGYDSVLCSMDL